MSALKTTVLPPSYKNYIILKHNRKFYFNPILLFIVSETAIWLSDAFDVVQTLFLPFLSVAPSIIIQRITVINMMKHYKLKEKNIPF